MPKKPISVPEEFLEDIRTSRSKQWAIIFGIAGIIAVGLIVLIVEVILNNHDEAIKVRPIPKPIVFQSVNDLQFTDPRTGDPLIWFAKTDTGYALYDGAGFYTDGTALKPAQSSDIVAIKQWVKEQIEAKEAAQKQLQEQQAAAEETAQKQADLASLKSLFQFQAPQNSSAVVVLGVDVSSLSPTLRDVLAGELKKQLASQFPSLTFTTAVLLPDFYDKGYFDKAFSGEVGFLDEVDFFKQAGVLLLVKPTVEFKDSAVVGGMKVCTLTVSCSSYISSTTQRHQESASVAKPAYAEEAALTQAVDALVEANSGDIKGLLEGKP
jgi:hypothetical protein